MRRILIAAAPLLFASSLTAQAPAAGAPKAAMLQFVRFADIFGGRLLTAFDSIPADKYEYRPTAPQQTVGYIAQHLEAANYGLCERFSSAKSARTAKDALADTVKAHWPKDTLVARLKASLDFCDTALDALDQLDQPALASNLLAFETDLAEHYSQLSVYMRLLGMTPPSSLPPKKRTEIAVPSATLAPYVGTYELAKGYELTVTLLDGKLQIQSSAGGAPVPLRAETTTTFFVPEADAEVAFTRDGSGRVVGLVLHQYGRNRSAKKIA